MISLVGKTGQNTPVPIAHTHALEGYHIWIVGPVHKEAPLTEADMQKFGQKNFIMGNDTMPDYYLVVAKEEEIKPLLLPTAAHSNVGMEVTGCFFADNIHNRLGDSMPSTWEVIKQQGDIILYYDGHMFFHYAAKCVSRLMFCCTDEHGQQHYYYKEDNSEKKTSTLLVLHYNGEVAEETATKEALITGFSTWEVKRQDGHTKSFQSYNLLLCNVLCEGTIVDILFRGKSVKYYKP